jgi:hypothetical protein
MSGAKVAGIPVPVATPASTRLRPSFTIGCLLRWAVLFALVLSFGFWNQSNMDGYPSDKLKPKKEHLVGKSAEDVFL